jgi:RNA polymerase sigma-70 factor (ECF subfamily)
MEMKSEDELVEEVLSGNHTSFELLLQPYRQGLLNMAYRMTGNLEEAKEVCQEALIKVYRYLDKFKKGRSFKSWIYRIAMNSAYDSLRRKKRYHDVVESQKSIEVSSVQGPEKQLLNTELKARIDTCLKDLSPKEKAVFLLRDEEGLSIEEASEILKCSSISVRTHLSRARKKIREQFERIDFTVKKEVRG